MIAILEKTEHNINFHQIVDFLKASHIRYALTISPTVYVSHIRQFWSTARIETTNLETKILATVDGKPRSISKSSLRRHLKLNDEEGISSLPDTELFENLSLIGYNIYRIKDLLFKKANFHISGSSTILTEPHHTPSPQEQHSPHHAPSSPSHPSTTTEPILQTPTETPTETPTLRRYTRRAIRIAQENINKTSALPHESSPRVTSLDADEGSMQHRLQKLMKLYTSLQRQQTQMAAKIKDQDLEISSLKAKVKSLKDKDRGSAEPTQKDAPIKGGSMEAANILTSKVAAVSVSSHAGVSTDGVPTVSRSFPTASAIFTTASVVTPYPRRPKGITIEGAQQMRSPIIRAQDKGKQTVVESDVSKKRKIQEQIDAQVAKEIKEEFVRENKRSNEVIAKHLQEYEQVAAELTVGERIELINELVKYQDHHAKILKYQAQQSKPLSKKEQREFYMLVLRSHAGWKTKHFRGMTLEEIKEKFIPVWKKLKDFVPMSSKEEEVYVEALQVKHPISDWEIYSEEKRILEDNQTRRSYSSLSEIFMLVEKDYPLRKGLATVMISNRLQVEQYSQIANDLILKRFSFDPRFFSRKSSLSHMVNPTDLGLYPPLPMQETASAGNAPSKSSYANVTSKPSGKKLNFCTFFTPGNNLLILKKWNPDTNLLKEDVSTILVWVKLHGVPVTAFSEDGLTAIAIKLGARETNNLKKLVKLLVVFCGNKKKGVESTIEVSNSNLFEVLNSVDNDVELGTNRGTTNLKFKELLTSGKATLVGEANNPLKDVEFLDDYDSKDEVASVDNEMAHFMTSERVGFGTQSLLEQWKDSYGNGYYCNTPK
nr:hypothetical protein [Tanacetum cinerariifolium]